MGLDVIGAGFGRTGTMSLKAALEQLGFDRCYHMIEVVNEAAQRDHRPTWLAAARGEPVDWDELFRGFRASVDWPSCLWWRDLAAHWPAAKIILTERDPHDWYRSVMATIYPASKENDWSDEMVWGPSFGSRVEDEAWVVERFLAHNQAVKDEVPPERLLVYRPGDGWEPLCAFLGLPVPDTPYPHVNSTADFHQRAARRRAQTDGPASPPSKL